MQFSTPMSTKLASKRQSPKWKNSAYAGTRLIRTGTTLSNLVLKVFLSQLRTDYCSGSHKARDILEKVKRAWTKLRAGGFVPKSGKFAALDSIDLRLSAAGSSDS